MESPHGGGGEEAQDAIIESRKGIRTEKGGSRLIRESVRKAHNPRRWSDGAAFDGGPDRDLLNKDIKGFELWRAGMEARARNNQWVRDSAAGSGWVL
jgi:hypothetical protein